MEIILVMNPQNSFLSKTGTVYMGEKAEVLAVRLRDYLSGFNGKKVFFREKHSQQDDFFVNDKTHSLVTTKEFEVLDFLKPCADFFYDKTRYNAFYKTGLEAFLKREKVTSVKLAGVETHTSILFTAEGLRNRGYDVTVVEPCSMSRDDHMHAYAIALMTNFLGVRVAA